MSDMFSAELLSSVCWNNKVRLCSLSLMQYLLLGVTGFLWVAQKNPLLNLPFFGGGETQDLPQETGSHSGFDQMSALTCMTNFT